MTMMIVWIVATAVFGILEAVTAQLVSIWFTIGAVAALGAYFLGADVFVQFAIFVGVSVLVLVLTRPFVKKVALTKEENTNVNALTGKDAVVVERISNIYSSGAVRINGNEWTARSVTGEIIEKGEIVTVYAVEGVKLIVSPKTQTQ